MFGVTTSCVDALREDLASEFEPIVFHATGTGGKTLEKLVSDGFLDGVVDVTTTEVADHLMGGILSSGSTRMDIYAKLDVPYVGSCGALDMVNFGAFDSVPEKYKDRLFHKHNDFITLMRTTASENQLIGE